MPFATLRVVPGRGAGSPPADAILTHIDNFPNPSNSPRILHTCSSVRSFISHPPLVPTVSVGTPCPTLCVLRPWSRFPTCPHHTCSHSTTFRIHQIPRGFSILDHLRAILSRIGT